MQFQKLERLKWMFWGVGIAAFVLLIAMTIVLQGHPDHLTAEYPECMRLNGACRCMTTPQKYIIEIAFLVFFISGFGNWWFSIRIAEETGRNPSSDNGGA